MHGNSYEYVWSSYKTTKDKMDIICKIHGMFKQTPEKHLIGQGCIKCSYNKISCDKKKPHEIFEQQLYEKCNEKYKCIDKYINSKTKIKFICEEHDYEFEQCPQNILRGHVGCPKCQPCGWSKAAQEWIESIEASEGKHIQHMPREPEKVIGGLKVDGWCEETQTIYEFHGDYWHGNPRKYQWRMDEVNMSNGKTFGQLYIETCEKTQYLRSLGYRVIEKWETN